MCTLHFLCTDACMGVFLVDALPGEPRDQRGDDDKTNIIKIYIRVLYMCVYKIYIYTVERQDSTERVEISIAVGSTFYLHYYYC